MKVENLKMIGFGTKGEDGIDEGIHLRWSFNDKLGFPSCFKLYRRKSNLKNKYEFPINGDDNLVTLDLPYTIKPKPNDSFKFRIDSAKTNNREINSLIVQNETIEDGSSVGILLIDGEVTLLFSKPISRIELKFVLEENSDFKIKLLSTEGSYYPYQIRGEVTGLQNLSFDADNTIGMVLSGTAIKLNWLAAWTCEKGKGWKRIKYDCGCGLPVNQVGSRYVNEVYPDTIGRDLATALCRLGDANVAGSQITAAEFVELKSMLLSMIEEGNEVPVGWSLFPNSEDEANVDEGTSADQTLEFSKYDFLLTQSLHVFFH